MSVLIVLVRLARPRKVFHFIFPCNTSKLAAYWIINDNSCPKLFLRFLLFLRDH